MRLNLRSRVQSFKGDGAWEQEDVSMDLPVERAAVLVCDVWDTHWCRGAAERAGALARRMDPVLKAARNNGVQVIHSPSDTMAFYAGHAARRHVTRSPFPEPVEVVVPPTPPGLPIDDSDGGCDTGQEPGERPWTRQHPAIEIADRDVISDSGREIYGFMRSRGMEVLLIMGVHTNMCILNRSFGIKQMTAWGMRCILVRDLTDAMYNPQRSPYVTHKEGTELVVRHIERYWCPTVLSGDLVKTYP